MNEQREKGWFKIAGVQDGDRTLDQQLRGLGPLVARAWGERVLDFGCAEGLIGKHLLECGAKSVLGFDVIEENVAEARRQCADFTHSPPQAEFLHFNLNDYDALPRLPYTVDIALLLAVLHKLRRPDRTLARIVRLYMPRLMVIRTAGATPGRVYDRRADLRRDIVLEDLLRGRYRLAFHTNGPFDEWTGYFERVERAR